MACVSRVCSPDVDTSGAHLFWTEMPPPAMLASIESMGQLEPVLARFHEGRWHVVSGYKRVHALDEVGADILVLEVPGPPDPLADGLLYLHANTHRVLDDGMRLRALRFFQAWMSPAEMDERIAVLLGLDPRSGVWARLMDWLDLPPSWDVLLCVGHLPLAAGPILAGLNRADQTVLEPYFAALKWSHSRAVQWLTFLTEAAKREDISLVKLLEQTGAPAVLTADLSPQDKLQRLFIQARTLRYPALTGLEDRFDGLRKELAGRSRWELSPSQNFETNAVELRLRARNAADIRQASRDLEQLAASKRLPELFSIAR